MAWLFAIVVLLLILFIPEVRVFVLGLLCVLFFVGLWFCADAAQRQRKRDKREEADSRKRISVSEVDFIEPRLKLWIGMSELTGRIKNNSRRFTLTRMKMKITMQDCTGDAPVSTRREKLLPPENKAGKNNCETVGETEESTEVNIPPGQVRDIEEFLDLPKRMVIKGRPKWSYLIEYLEGR